MKSKPILFKTEMINKIMSGEKTMTRRIKKSEKCKYEVGDILYVKETFSRKMLHEEPPGEYYWYKSDYFEYDEQPKWKSPMFMPREAARIFLKVVNIKSEKLHDISEQDILKEGVRIPVSATGHLLLNISSKIGARDFLPTKENLTSYQIFFAHWAECWCRINGLESWQCNPDVWVIEFERISKPEDF